MKRARVWLLIMAALAAVAGMIVGARLMAEKDLPRDASGVPDWSEYGKKVVFFGDSITELCDLDVFYPGLNSVNSGVSGDETSNMLARVDSAVLNREPDVVVILGGINDLLTGRSEESIVDNLHTIVERILLWQEKTQILLLSVYPVSEGGARTVTGHIQSLNEKIEKLAAETACRYVDVYSVLCQQDGTLAEPYSYDGLHLSEEGYRAAVPVIAGALQEEGSRASNQKGGAA